MSKTLCELGKTKRQKHMKKQGKFRCGDCDRTVNRKDRVCKPEKT